MSETLQEALTDRVLLADGAMGTQLQQAGLESGACGEAWNVARPERVLAIQRRYVEAGSDCLITNTFGGSRIMLERHGCGDEVAAINRAAVGVAREAFDGGPGFVIGDIGPFGAMMEPLGDVPEQRVRDAFTEQAEALVEAGADAIIVETQISLEELAIGVEAARGAGAPCVIGSMAFDLNLKRGTMRTMMGVDPTGAAGFMRDVGVDIVALNCGTGIDVANAAEAIKLYRAACDLPTMAQPNAGSPEIVAGNVVYRQTPSEMVAELDTLLSAGPRIVGACCGSTPDHIQQFRLCIDKFNAQQREG